MDQGASSARQRSQIIAGGAVQDKIVKLHSGLMAKDKTIAHREQVLAKAIKRAETAEKSNKTLESNARKSRSDFDSALQKKDNDINTHKRKSEQAIKSADVARRELKDVRIQTGKRKKKVSRFGKTED